MSLANIVYGLVTLKIGMLCRIFPLEIHGFAINFGIVVFLVYGKTDKGIGFFKVEHKEGRRFVHNGCLISIQFGYGIFIAKFRCAQASLIEGITLSDGCAELRGLTVNAEQAVELARLFGLRVK